MGFATFFPIEKSVVYLVSFAVNMANLNLLKIYDTDADISVLNEKTSFRLNELGCILHHKSLKRL